MPAPIVVAKAALETDKQVRSRIPGGWWTFIILVFASILIIPTMVVYGINAAVAPLLKGGSEEICESLIGTNNAAGNNDAHKPGANDGGGSGPGSTADTPWPESDSKTVTWPAPNPNIASGWGKRAPFMAGGKMTPGFHNGLDFGQAMGSPVLSVADGIVATAKNGTSIYGSHIAIKHTIDGKHYTSMYGHIIGNSIQVKVGQKVKAGEQIAKVGSEGMSTGPHIHLVITMGDYSHPASEPGYTGGAGNTIDPASFLKSKGVVTASGGLKGGNFNGVSGEQDFKCEFSDDGLEGNGFTAWGGYENGEITASLGELDFAPGKELMGRAANDLEELNAKFRAKFGKDLRVITAYEDLDAQERKYNNGGTTLPGKSIYGWARAVKLDLKFGTAEYKWMQKNAEKYGWVQTSTYEKGGSGAHAGIWGYAGTGSSTGDVPPASSASAKEARQMAKEILEEEYGWGQNEYVCLVNLWSHESNWNYKAENPSSGAYGIVQALPPEKMSSVADDWRTNPKTQIRWGLGYIEGRYGTPCGAWEFWQETDPAKKHGIGGNWY